ncbi:hypothetical protein L596_013046 [Steinernema carpocapsae]|uniref:Uncharacterized protein n=1 Tax=Steinernema carpocapsae TaxID=34508 RepID=A0A4U5NZP0_STECR|nr:hypothetical protein L596_013046 [Steinernema carpocapsae]
MPFSSMSSTFPESGFFACLRSGFFDKLQFARSIMVDVYSSPQIRPTITTRLVASTAQHLPTFPGKTHETIPSLY